MHAAAHYRSKSTERDRKFKYDKNSGRPHSELEGQLDDLKVLLEQKQTIAMRYAQLKATNEQDQALEQARIRHEALTHERDRLEHAVSLAKQICESQRAALTERLKKNRALTVESEELAERNGELQTHIEYLWTKVTERDQLKEQGATLKTQIKSGGNN